MHKYDVISSKVKVTGSQKVKFFRLEYLSHFSIDFHESCVKYIWSQVLLIYLKKIGSRSQLCEGQGQKVNCLKCVYLYCFSADFLQS